MRCWLCGRLRFHWNFNIVGSKAECVDAVSCISHYMGHG